MDAEVVQRQWLERSGAYSPRYYAYYGPDETSEAIQAILDRTGSSDVAILELGCSSGRHLAHLNDQGYTNLNGIDINEDAFAVMADCYPALASNGTFFCGAIEDIITDFDDEQFDVVYAVETLQHIHPDNSWVFEEIARITADVLITAEIETSTSEGDNNNQDVNYVSQDLPLYYRDWKGVFTALEFSQTEWQAVGRETLRVFRRD